MSPDLFPARALPVSLSHAERGGGGGSGEGFVAEFVTFRLVDGTDPASFLQNARATEAPLATRAGFLRRTLSVDETSTWTDHVEWTDLEAARSAAAEVLADPAFAPFMAAIDPAGMTMRHARVRWTMGD